jgi:hypothetical protein
VLFPAVMRWHGLSNRLGFAQCVPFEEFVVAEVLTGTDDSASSIVAASASLLRAGRIGRCALSKGSEFCERFVTRFSFGYKTCSNFAHQMVRRVGISRVTRRL